MRQVPHLAGTAFGRCRIWPVPHLAGTAFGRCRIWPVPHLAGTAFGRRRTWPVGPAGPPSLAVRQGVGWAVKFEIDPRASVVKRRPGAPARR